MTHCCCHPSRDLCSFFLSQKQGCKKACKFWVFKKSKDPIINAGKTLGWEFANLTRAENSSSQVSLTWPSGNDSHPPTVYVVLTALVGMKPKEKKSRNKQWQVIGMTRHLKISLDGSTREPRSKSQAVPLFVLGVSATLGLEKVYQFRPTVNDDQGSIKLANTGEVNKSSSSSSRTSNDIPIFPHVPHSLGQSYDDRRKTQNLSNSGSPPWNLKIMSMVQHKFLVLTELSWSRRSEKGNFLLTWEILGGGLKGNLVTDSNYTVINLLPHTAYSIQVFHLFLYSLGAHML